MRAGVLALMASLALPQTAEAIGGSWSQSSAGGVISVGRQAVPDAWLAPSNAIPVAASVTQLSWRITLLSPPPPGLEIRLCSATGCIQLEGLSGQRKITPRLPASGPFRFIYAVTKRGQIIPPVRVQRSQLTINYRE